MQITIVTIGTRGDVQPYVALSLGLQAAGHSVRLATHGEFETFVRGYGLEFFPIQGDPRAALSSDTGQDWQRSGRNPIRSLYRLRQIAEPIVVQLTADVQQACQGADLVIYSVLGFFPVWAAISHRMPMAAAYLQPSTPTKTFSSYRLPTVPRPLQMARAPYNWLTHLLAEQIFWQMLRGPLNEARRKLTRPPLPLGSPYKVIRRQRQPHLYGYSPHVVPPPADWPTNNYVTGYWFLDHPATWQPPTDLLAFLEAGPPPVYIGFGSMNNRNPQEVAAIALRALEQTGQRGILLTGWGGLRGDDLPENVFQVESVPFDWLFPRMAAVVHHGGAGTTAEGLRAGVPSVIIPFMVDQPFWGQRVAQLGVGPTPIPHKELSVERLAAAIHTVTRDPQMQQQAATLGQRIRTEDGVGRAVQILNTYMQRTKGSVAPFNTPGIAVGI